MGLLDDLQSEVDKIKADERAKKAEREAQDEFYRVHLHPVMCRARDYLGEVVANLKIVKPDVRPVYPFNPLQQTGVAFSQGDYSFDFDSGPAPRHLDIRCSCELRQRQEFHVPTREAVLKLSDLLASHDFPFHRKDYRDKRHEIRSALFILEGPMWVRIQIAANAADRCIYVKMRNLEDLPVKRYKFNPEQVNETLLERLGRVLLREKSTLVKVEMSAEARRNLRVQVEADKRREAEELAQATAELEAEKQAEEQARLINRYKRTLISATGDALSKLRTLKSEILGKMKNGRPP